MADDVPLLQWGRGGESLRRHLPLTDATDLEYHAENPLSILEKEEESLLLRIALGMPRPKLREAVEADIDLGEAGRQAANWLGVPIETLRTRKKKAIEQLRKILALFGSAIEDPSSLLSSLRG